METPESIRASLRKGEWVTSIDLTDAYLHVPIHTLSRKYLRFCHKGVIYQFTSLPFGLATAPLVFTNLVKEVKLIALQQEIRLHQYLDDWLIRAPSKQVCIEQTQKLLKLGCSCEAHARQVDKTSGDVPSPLSEVYYQCKDSHVHHWIACINGEDCKTGQDTYETISVASQNSLEISDASGHTNSLESEDDTTRGMVVRPSKRATRRVSPPKGTRNSITDASNAGWGAHLNQESTGGLWSQHEKHLHINLLELKAVFLALQFFKKNCSNNLVLIASDNTSVVSYINKQGGTKSADLCALIWRILTWCHNNKVTLIARHIPGSLNVIADGLSRRKQIQSTE